MHVQVTSCFTYLLQLFSYALYVVKYIPGLFLIFFNAKLIMTHNSIQQMSPTLFYKLNLITITERKERGRLGLYIKPLWTCTCTRRGNHYDMILLNLYTACKKDIREVPSRTADVVCGRLTLDMRIV